MKAWKHVLESENLGIVLASSRRSAEKVWKRAYPQSEPSYSEYFLEEATEFSEMNDPEGTVRDWNDQLSRRVLMEHNRGLDEYMCPLSSFEGRSCKYCLSWSVCPYNELTDFLIDETGKFYDNPDGRDITSKDFERRQRYEIDRLRKLREIEDREHERESEE